MTPSPPVLCLLSAVAQASLLAVLPDGGQARSRRNAWAGRSAGAARARARRDADLAVRDAQARAAAAARGTGVTGR